MNIALLRQYFFTLFLIAIGWVIVPQAHAAANITCSTTGTTLSFGTLDPNNTTDVTGTISFSCTNTGSQGTASVCYNYAGSAFPLSMTSGGNNLNFTIYANSGRTTVWGNTNANWVIGPAVPPLSVPANGSASGTATIYGRVPGGQTSAAAGSYSFSFSGAAVQMTVSSGSGNSAPSDCNSSVSQGPVATNVSFNSTATVQYVCSVTAPTLNFGSLAQLTSATNGSTNLSVNCVNLTPYNVGLDAGLNGGGNVNARKMKLGASTISYQLYSNSGRTTVWGNTVGTNTVSGIGNGLAQPYTAYGQVPIQTTPPPGAYTDTVTISVTY